MKEKDGEREKKRRKMKDEENGERRDQRGVGVDCRPNRSRLSELPRVDRTSDRVKEKGKPERRRGDWENIWRYNEEEEGENARRGRVENEKGKGVSSASDKSRKTN